LSDPIADSPSPARNNRSRWFWGILFIAGLIGIAVTLQSILVPKRTAAVNPPSRTLIVHVAASLRVPMEAIAAEYTRETGNEVEVRLGPSQTLLANIELSRQGDLYLPADDSYLALARSKNLTAEVIPIATQSVRVVVQRGNPKRIATLDDLLRPDVRLAQANPDSAAIGKLIRTALQKRNEWDILAKKTIVFKPAVTEVANDVKLGTADAAFGWDTMSATYPDLEMLSIPPLDTIVASVSATVLSTTTDATAALRFARYLSASDRGLPHFARAGFKVAAGDKWAEMPEIAVFAGAMLRPAIEETITAFESREGVRVARIYNGCGILVAQMKSGKHPDAYISCDVAFMKQVDDLFDSPRTLSRNRLVIAVQKGNPHNIQTLKDLGRKGLRVGVGHEQQCALGAITKQTFLAGKVYGDVSENIVVQVPAGDMLVNQMRTGSLDAAVVYVSNMKLGAGELDAVPITGIPCSIVAQPAAIGRETQFPQLSKRLIDRLLTADSERIFRDWGFDWVGGSNEP